MGSWTKVMSANVHQPQGVKMQQDGAQAKAIKLASSKHATASCS
ncbi:hypothetical protein [Anaerobiospirillum succiniciproducens]